MIVNYLMKIEENGESRTHETVIGGIETVDISEKDIILSYPVQGVYQTTFYPKEHHQIYQMYLLNDDFKTLRRLI